MSLPTGLRHQAEDGDQPYPPGASALRLALVLGLASVARLSYHSIVHRRCGGADLAPVVTFSAAMLCFRFLDKLGVPWYAPVSFVWQLVPLVVSRSAFWRAVDTFPVVEVILVFSEGRM